MVAGFVSSFGLQSQRGRPMVSRRTRLDMAVGILFSTTTGNTSTVADLIKQNIGSECKDPIDVGDISSASDYADCTGFIVGAPTWNTDADEDRSGTPMDEFINDGIEQLNLSGKPVAIFGLGDSVGYGDNLCDAIEELHDKFSSQGAKMVGYTDEGGYSHSSSKSAKNGKFLGLPLDEDNESDMTEDRIKNWCAQLKSEMSL
uniref:Flavodoxin-like domain-containing protein n=1 Tax=Rhodosorus marinus TaxID=101924 RepID=A0A7S3E951_9RHOD|mmetsp:Transcript_17971/g.71969  ORF Transcript_17971/g.71969 Transcript_17971/m.71969 type:complete len:202 (+) Transcript_17971:189-794(+)